MSKNESGVFRNRGTSVTRLEGFSDAVFALTLTLLVVSAQVPQTYDDLMRKLGGFLPFSFCFVLLFVIWFQHYRFFRRFGLEDRGTMLLNALLLFVVLFFAFPLKFLFTISFTDVNLSFEQQRTLFIVYGLGFAAVFAVYALFHLNAWRQRAALDLTRFESYDTITELGANLVTAAVGLGSALLALSHATMDLAGYFYFMIIFTQFGYHWLRGRRWRRLAHAATPPARQPAPVAPDRAV